MLKCQYSGNIHCSLSIMLTTDYSAYWVVFSWAEKWQSLKIAAQVGIKVIHSLLFLFFPPGTTVVMLWFFMTIAHAKNRMWQICMEIWWIFQIIMGQLYCSRSELAASKHILLRNSNSLLLLRIHKHKCTHPP